MKRLLVILLAALMCCPLVCGAEEAMPLWEYPLAPEILENKAGFITLVNRDHLLDGSYAPDDLVTIDVRCVSSIKGDKLRKTALAAMRRMFDAAEADGMILYLKSVYRAYSTQSYMYKNRLNNVGRDDGVVAYPGSSDHQTGLGADILNYAWTLKDGMNKDFANTDEAQWMLEHCQEFGFILRYMEDKEEITAIKFEPWHFRYVGREAAAYIMENHLSLEEFTDEWKSYVADYEAAGGNFQQLILWRARIRDAVVVDVNEDGEEEYSIFY